jgi:hypothetical protein
MRGLITKNRLRDITLTTAAVAVMLMASLAVNEQWRRSVASAAHDVHTVASSPTVVAFSGAAGGVLASIQGFRADNPFLFAFLLVAAVLVVLMVRT